MRLVTAKALAKERVAALPAVQDAMCNGTEATFRTTRPTEMLAALALWLAADTNEIVDLQIRQASLEDVFIGLTQGAQKR